MRIVIYLEGDSDRIGLEVLLKSLMQEWGQAGCLVRPTSLDGKDCLMSQSPRKAVAILRGDRQAHVFAVPDLYPPNVVHPHSTCDQLKRALTQAFLQECRRLRIDPQPLLRRFHVHCFKHDFEVLLLACEERLKNYTGTQPLAMKWTRPVEDQDHSKPPKRVVEELFRHSRRRYDPKYDAPRILDGADPAKLAELCPQCFKPFLQDLQTLAGKSSKTVDA